MISATDAIHVTKEGSDAVKAAKAGEKASEDWLKYQLTSFKIGEYYNIGQVANRVFYNGNNNIDVTLTDDAVWNVTGSGIIRNLTAASKAITSDKAVTITVKGTLKLDGAVITDTKVVGNVTYKVDTDYIGKYSDLDADAWYAKGADGETLKYVLAQGLMEGSDGKFSPNAALTREQLAVVLYRASGSPAVTGELKAPDASKVSAWASDAMKWAVEQKIITGNDKGELNPKGTVDRQTMAVMLFRWADGKVADGRGSEGLQRRRLRGDLGIRRHEVGRERGPRAGRGRQAQPRRLRNPDHRRHDAGPLSGQQGLMVPADGQSDK